MGWVVERRGGDRSLTGPARMHLSYLGCPAHTILLAWPTPPLPVLLRLLFPLLTTHTYCLPRFRPPTLAHDTATYHKKTKDRPRLGWAQAVLQQGGLVRVVAATAAPRAAWQACPWWTRQASSEAGVPHLSMRRQPSAPESLC